MNMMEYLLNHFQEECAEAIQAAAKVKRFGQEMTHAKINGMTNQEVLEDEVKDVLLMVKRLQDRGVIRTFTIEELVRHEMEKTPKGDKYMQISRDLGRLSE